MEEDCGGGQGLTKGCGAKGRRNRNIQTVEMFHSHFHEEKRNYILCIYSHILQTNKITYDDKIDII
jgi:hypothetical protein